MAHPKRNSSLTWTYTSGSSLAARSSGLRQLKHTQQHTQTHTDSAETKQVRQNTLKPRVDVEEGEEESVSKGREMKKRWKDEKIMKEGYESIYNPRAPSSASTAGEFSSTAVLRCCSDLMNIHHQAEKARQPGSWQHFDVLLANS